MARTFQFKQHSEPEKVFGQLISESHFLNCHSLQLISESVLRGGRGVAMAMVAVAMAMATGRGHGHGQ